MNILEIFEVNESYKLPDVIMGTLLSDRANEVLQKLEENDI